MSEKEKVTIFRKGEFLGGIVKTEARLIEHGRKPYAQYPDAPFVIFIPKRKRKARIVHKGYDPYIVILKGWGHDIEPDSMMMPSKSGSTPGVMVSESRYTSFDPRWVSDFEAKLSDYLEANPDVESIAFYTNDSKMTA